jgi:formamidopyrimidine-DNA glycosylase
MFELPEIIVLSSQMKKTIAGKIVRGGATKNVAHKFVWHTVEGKAFAKAVAGKRVGNPVLYGRWMSLPLEPGYALLFGECGGSFRFESSGATPPDKFHLLLEFEDGSFLWARTAMWGAYELHEAGKELERQYVKDQRPGPLDLRFDQAYFDRLVESLSAGDKRSAKSLLTQDQLIPGLGNAIAQDILFDAAIAPKRDIGELSKDELKTLRKAIISKVREIAAAGGRNDEKDLFGEPGGYARIMDKAATKRPCPRCGGKVSEAQYLGGAIYWCPACQR